jgi:hypothetical protein
MRRLIAPLALAVVLVPGTAQAHSKTQTYRGTFQYVGADGEYVTGSFGKAQLVDGRRNDKLSVHVRRLARRATYLYRLESSAKACEAGAPGGTPVSRFKRLRTNRAGVANSTWRSRSFSAKRNLEYLVAVYRVTATGTPGEIALCAELRGKKPHGHGPRKREHGHARGHHDHPRGHDKHRGKPEHTPGHAEDKPRGKSDDAPGHTEDKSRGKSEDAPGHAEDKPRGHSEDAPGRADDKPRGKSDDAPGHNKPRG